MCVDASMLASVDAPCLSIDGEDYPKDHDSISIKMEFSRSWEPPLDTSCQGRKRVSLPSMWVETF